MTQKLRSVCIESHLIRLKAKHAHRWYSLWIQLLHVGCLQSPPREVAMIKWQWQKKHEEITKPTVRRKSNKVYKIKRMFARLITSLVPTARPPSHSDPLLVTNATSECETMFPLHTQGKTHQEEGIGEKSNTPINAIHNFCSEIMNKIIMMSNHFTNAKFTQQIQFHADSG